MLRCYPVGPSTLSRLRIEPPEWRLDPVWLLQLRQRSKEDGVLGLYVSHTIEDEVRGIIGGKSKGPMRRLSSVLALSQL